MVDRASRQTITESVVESANSAVELADSTADSSEDPVKIGLWVRGLKAGSHRNDYERIKLKTD